MNGKKAKSLRKAVTKTCAETGVINERDLFQANHNGSLELEQKTIRATYKKMKSEAKKVSHKA
jgi:hypothetical protein